MQEACLCSRRNSKEANEAGGVRTRVAAVGTREGPADQTVCNLRGQEPDFWFSSEPGCLWGEGNGTLLQYSCLENPMDRGAWWAAVHGVAKSRTRLSVGGLLGVAGRLSGSGVSHSTPRGLCELQTPSAVPGSPPLPSSPSSILSPPNWLLQLWKPSGVRRPGKA